MHVFNLKWSSLMVVMVKNGCFNHDCNIDQLAIEAHVNATILFIDWPCGLMDKASVSGAEDCRFESCHGRTFCHLKPEFRFNTSEL